MLKAFQVKGGRIESVTNCLSDLYASPNTIPVNKLTGKKFRTIGIAQVSKILGVQTVWVRKALNEHSMKKEVIGHEQRVTLAAFGELKKIRATELSRKTCCNSKDLNLLSRKEMVKRFYLINTTGKPVNSQVLEEVFNVSKQTVRTWISSKKLHADNGWVAAEEVLRFAKAHYRYRPLFSVYKQGEL